MLGGTSLFALSGAEFAPSCCSRDPLNLLYILVEGRWDWSAGKGDFPVGRCCCVSPQELSLQDMQLYDITCHSVFPQNTQLLALPWPHFHCGDVGNQLRFQPCFCMYLATKHAAADTWYTSAMSTVINSDVPQELHSQRQECESTEVASPGIHLDLSTASACE